MKLRLALDRRVDAVAYQRTDATASLADLHRPNGLRREHHVVELEGPLFDQARAELLALRWFPSGLVRPVPCRDGVTVVQRLRIGPLEVDVPIRVVERIEEPTRAAIAAVTVRGHPERGIERYELVLDPALGRATLTVDKAWELADPLARLASPFSTWLQAYATRLSLRRFREGSW